MRTINGKDKIFSKLINSNDEVTFNILNLIREDENSFIVTDDNSYIIAQSNERTPMWIYLKEKPENPGEIAEIILDRLANGSKFNITANENYISDVLNIVTSRANLKCRVNMKMNVYSCTKVNKCEVRGKVVRPNKKYRDIMAKLIIQMEADAEKREVSEKDAYGYADDNSDSKKLFLWEDEKVTAMAKVGHKTDKYARLNTVVTDREQRNKGYAKMLVSEISSMVLNEKLIPMLYADASNPASNKVYQEIGYKKQGEITEFILE